MLTHDELVDLYQKFRDQPVLSVYVDADQHDPAERRKWRREVESGVAACRASVDGGPREEVDAFEEAWRRIEAELAAFDAFLPGRGWVGFATEEAFLYGESIPVPMPDRVRWERGLRVAPYIRGLKQHRPVIVVLADSRKARLFEYLNGEVHEVEDLRADTDVGDLSDVGMRKRAGRETGVRGETSTDQAQRILEVSSERMLKRLVGALVDRVGDDGFLVLGGTPEMVRHASEAVPETLSGRVEEVPSLHLDLNASQVKEAAEKAASEITRRRQAADLDALVDEARSGGRGCLGRKETEQALREMRVHTLFLSRSFIASAPDFADHCVGTAFAQGADIEELSGASADRLDEAGGGLGARLRFRIREPGDSDPDRGDEAA